MKNYSSPDINPDEIADIFVSMTSLIFNQLPIPINFVDKDSRIIIMNQAFLDFLQLELNDVIGKPVSDIDPTVRLPIIVKTGKAEIGYKHIFQNGHEAIVHRLPLFYKDVIIGGVGIILLQDMQQFYNFFHEKNILNALDSNSSSKISDVYKAKYTFDDILTHSPLGKKTKTKAKAYADTDFPVLITGESGVGKELFAHSIHSSSPRKDGPFIRINLASIPESLIESELFGYENGAFTGAKKSGKAGKFELSNGGTIFLDEIGEIPMYLQVKLLRVLQERELERIGGNEIVKLDLRVIAATNCNLEDKIKRGEFRQDLFYRLNVLNLKVPSLKERKTDISLLIKHFTTKMYQEFGILKNFPQEVIEILINYSWPGNVRELKNIIERTAINASSEDVTINDIPQYIIESTKSYSNFEFGDNYLKNTLLEIEKKLILDTLKKNNYNKAQTAKDLGIPRMSLYRKLNDIELNQQ